jgi:hypothetical protein
MKIAELLENYRSLDKSAKPARFKLASEKTAFVPNPDIAAAQQQQQQMPPQGMPPQGMPPQGMPPQGMPPQGMPPQGMPPQGMPPQGMPPQGMPPQGMPPQGMPPQGMPPQGMPPQGMPPQGMSPLLQELMMAVEQLPPEIQQQVMPLIQQIMSMPPEQSEQYLQSLLQQMTTIQQGQGQGAPQQAGMEAQAQDMALGGDLPPEAYAAPLSGEEEAENAEASAIEAKNELDNVRVSLTVRELLDLIGKGSATASLLKVKQLADSHKQKMEQIKQKTEADQAQKTQQQAEQQNSLMGGGIYPSPMDANAAQ